MVERSEAKSVKLSFASKIKIRDILTRNFASHFLLRFAQPFLAKFKWTINWSLSPQGLILLLFYNHFSRSRQSSNPNNSKARSSKSHDISQHFIKNSSKKDKITPEKTNSPKLNSFSPLEDVQLIDSSEDEDETQISMFRTGLHIRANFLGFPDRRPTRDQKFLYCPTEARPDPKLPENPKVARKPESGRVPSHFSGPKSRVFRGFPT